MVGTFLAGSALCCAGKACCDSCCAGLKQCGIPAKNFPRVAYVVQDILLMIAALIIMFTLRPAADEVSWLNCTELAGGGSSCFGESTVLRASLSLFLTHLFVLLAICPRAQCSSAIHDGFWCIKIFLLIALFAATFWIPYQFFFTWAWICRIGAIFFLIIQAYFLLNQAYIWNDELLAKFDGSSDQCYAQFLLLSYSIAAFLISTGWIVFMWFFFRECASGLFTLIVTSVAVGFFTIVALLKIFDVNVFRQNATVFVTGNVNLYITYLGWTAVASNPHAECNPFIESGWNTFAQIAVGLVFTFVTIWSIAIASSAQSSKSKEKTSAAQEIIEENEEAAKPEGEANEQAAIFPVTIPTIIYQFVLMNAALYFGMLFTNWGFIILDNAPNVSEAVKNAPKSAAGTTVEMATGSEEAGKLAENITEEITEAIDATAGAINDAIEEGDEETAMEEEAALSGGFEQEDLAEFAMWTKMTMQWLTIALMTVSVTLPICCPDKIL